MKRRIVILADNKFGPMTSKMANGAIRFLTDEVVAVIDSRNAGKTVSDVLGFGGDIPVFATLEETLQQDPNTLLIGISPPGGRFPSEWYPLIIQAIQNRLNIVSGLHEYLCEIAEFNVLAEKYNVKITDLRRTTQPDILARGLAKKFRSKIILTVGSHGNVGKMTATIALVREMQKLGKSADWLATGQIGILIKGKGVPTDTLKGDFISGGVEAALASMDGNFEYIFIEGQGSLQHLGFSPVALGILHGCLPDMMIMCHRTDMKKSDYGVDITNLPAIVRLNEQMISFIKPAPVHSICVNTFNLSREKAEKTLADIQKTTGLYTTDPIRFGVEEIAQGIISHFKKHKKKRL